MSVANTLGLAAQVAFWVFLAILPLAAVLGLVIARVAVSRTALEASLLASLPRVSRELFSSELARVANWNGGAVAPIAGATFLWLASGGVHSIFDGLELQAGASRPYWRKRLVALVACVVASVGGAIVGVLSASLRWILRLVGREVVLVRSPMLSPLWDAGRVVAVLAIATGIVAGLYWTGTPPAVRRRRLPILPGALFAVVFDAVAGWGYQLVLRWTGIGAGYEAGLAVIGVTMTSLYVLTLGVLAGAALNQSLGSSARGDRS